MIPTPPSVFVLPRQLRPNIPRCASNCIIPTQRANTHAPQPPEQQLLQQLLFAKPNTHSSSLQRPSQANLLRQSTAALTLPPSSLPESQQLAQPREIPSRFKASLQQQLQWQQPSISPTEPHSNLALHLAIAQRVLLRTLPFTAPTTTASISRHGCRSLFTNINRVYPAKSTQRSHINRKMSLTQKLYLAHSNVTVVRYSRILNNPRFSRLTATLSHHDNHKSLTLTPPQYISIRTITKYLFALGKTGAVLFLSTLFLYEIRTLLQSIGYLPSSSLLAISTNTPRSPSSSSSFTNASNIPYFTDFYTIIDPDNDDPDQIQSKLEKFNTLQQSLEMKGYTQDFFNQQCLTLVLTFIYSFSAFCDSIMAFSKPHLGQTSVWKNCATSSVFNDSDHLTTINHSTTILSFLEDITPKLYNQAIVLFNKIDPTDDVGDWNVKNPRSGRPIPAHPDLLEAIPTERRYFMGRTIRMPRFKGFVLNSKGFSSRYSHDVWPIQVMRVARELIYKIFLPFVDFIEWIAWAPQKYMAQRIADVFFFFDAKVAYHTQNFVKESIYNRFSSPLTQQLDNMRKDGRTSFEISLFLLNFIGASAKDSYRVIENALKTLKTTDAEVEFAIAELEKELRELQQTSTSEVELFAEHYRIYADNLPIYFSERLRPFLLRLSEQPYDPLYKYFLFTFDKPQASLPPLENKELLILDRQPIPYPVWFNLTRFKRNMLQLRLPFEDWSEHNKLLPTHLLDSFESALSHPAVAWLAKGLFASALLTKIPLFQRFFYRHGTLSYENRYKLHTYFSSSFVSFSLFGAIASTFLYSNVFEHYSSHWGKDTFLWSLIGMAGAINVSTQIVNLSLARLLLTFNIHRSALLTPQNGPWPLIMAMWAYTSRQYPDGDMRLVYFPVGTKVDALVGGAMMFDVMGFLFFTLLFNRRTGIPHLSNLFGYLAGLTLYRYHSRRYGVDEHNPLLTNHSTLDWVNGNINEKFIFFNNFVEPPSYLFKFKRTLWLDDIDVRRMRYERGESFAADIKTDMFIESWNLLYRYANHRDFTVVEDNINKLRQLRQEWRAKYGDEETKREVELGIEDKNIPYLLHSSRFAQQQLERMQNIVEAAWTTYTGNITPKEWRDLEYEQHTRKGPLHPIESSQHYLDYNRKFESPKRESPFPGRTKHRASGLHARTREITDQFGHDDDPGKKWMKEREMENFNLWWKQMMRRGAQHFTLKQWYVFRLNPHLFPRISENQKRWFHPQDEFYQRDWRTLRWLRKKQWKWEFHGGGGLKFGIRTMWNRGRMPWREQEGLMNEAQQFRMKFATTQKMRQAMIKSSRELGGAMYHPYRIWQAQERRRKVHKYYTFPRWKRDDNIAWGTRKKVHRKNNWFPIPTETSSRDDFDLEEPLIKNREYNPFIRDKAGVRMPIYIESSDPEVRGLENAEPTYYADWERKMGGPHIPLKTNRTKMYLRTRAFNNIRYPEADKNPAYGYGWLSKRYRKPLYNRRRTSTYSQLHSDEIKGRYLQIQSYWGRSKKFNFKDKNKRSVHKIEEISEDTQWDMPWSNLSLS